MPVISNRRNLLFIWCAAVAFLVALALVPVSYRVTRASGLVLSLMVWFVGLALLWRWRWARFAHLTITVLAGAFFLMPPRAKASSESLRERYAASLRKYEGVTYYWGGENARGIDCSGLVRRGLINAMISEGMNTLDGGMVRQAATMWWNDCTARALVEPAWTNSLLESPSINALDHSQIRSGDIAVTANGLHVLAYLGENRWIEADPGIGRVLIAEASAKDNPWLKVPVRICRWRVLAL